MGILTSSLIVSVKDATKGGVRSVLSSLSILKKESEGVMRSPMFSGMRGLALSLGGFISLREGIKSTVGAAIEFESAMSDVKKVVNFDSKGEFESFRHQVLDLSRHLPVAATGLAAIMAAAGQANIPKEELSQFTEMTAKVSTAWDTAAGETGDALAKMKTGLGLTLKETGLLADAINHLSNNSAASAPNILKFSRGLASGKIAGFAAKDTLAFGAAMIGSGFEAEVAETSFRNMARALTAGQQATKGQQKAFHILGLNSTKVAKAMQKDAVGTTMKVLEQIKKLPKYAQGAISSALFGEEARALPALINNMDELKRTLGLVSEEAKFSGSAQREYDQASQRTANTLKLLKNNLTAIGIGFGDLALPTINQWAGNLADTLMTLGQRVTVFDKISDAFRGFTTGLGFAPGDIGQQFSTLMDQIFGKIDTFEKDTQRLGKIFAEFRTYGENVHYFASQIGDVAKSFGDLTGIDVGHVGEVLGSIVKYGFGLSMAGLGLSIVATGIRSLASAVMFLSGASLLIGGAKGIGKILGAFTGGAAAGATTTATTTAATAGTGLFAGLASGIALPLAMMTGSAAATAWLLNTMANDKGFMKSAGKLNWDFGGGQAVDALDKWFSDPAKTAEGPKIYSSDNPDPLNRPAIDTSTVAPSGPQKVELTNPPPRPNVSISISAPVTVNEASDGAALARDFATHLRSEISGIHSDIDAPGGY